MAIPLPMSVTEIKDYIRRNHAKKGGVAMARDLGVSLPTIHKYAKMAGVSVSSSLVPTVANRQEVERRIAFIRKEGGQLTAKQISEHLDVAEHSVNRLVKRHNLKVKRRVCRKVSKKKKKAKKVSKYFNVHARENWLL